MVTKEQALNIRNERLHYTGRHECTRTVGPRGGITESITQCRPNGQCKTWKTRPAEFQLPVKYGLYEYAYLTQDNTGDFHLASECPLNKPKPSTLPTDLTL